MKTFVLTLIPLFLCAVVQAANPIGFVLGLSGTAVATDRNGAVRSLTLKSEIFLNDTIITKSASTVEIQFEDQTLFSQGENSEMTINRYVYNPANAEDNRFGARLRKGVFRTVTGQIPILNREGFAVETPRSVIGIRGCILGFMISEDQDRVFIVEVENEQIIIQPFTGQPGAVYEEVCMVTLGDDGELIQEPLTPEIILLIQQITGGSGDQGGNQNGNQNNNQNQGEGGLNDNDADGSINDGDVFDTPA